MPPYAALLRSSSWWSMIGDAAVRRCQRTALAHPLQQTAAHRVRTQSRRAKRLCRHPRARADTAVEDDRPLPIELTRACRELDELNMAAAGDVTRLALVNLAHVNDLQVRVAREPVRHHGGIQVDLRGIQVDLRGVRGDPRAIRVGIRSAWLVLRAVAL